MGIDNRGSLLVVNYDNKKLLGIVKASRLRGVQNTTDTAQTYMCTKFSTLLPEQSILDALQVVTEEHRSTVPVINETGCLKGLVTRSSLVTVLSQQYFDCVEEVEE